MFENAIQELDAMGIPYSETEDGGLIIEIGDVDKTDLITIIGFLNDNGIDFVIDETTITIPGEGDNGGEEAVPGEEDLMGGGGMPPLPEEMF